jgi:hypothetical protein
MILMSLGIVVCEFTGRMMSHDLLMINILKIRFDLSHLNTFLFVGIEYNSPK